PTLDNVGSRNVRVFLVDDLPGIGVECEAACALFRCLSNLQKLAFTFEVNVLASPDVAQHVWRWRIIIATENRPNRRIFGTEPPDCVGGGAISIRRVDFIVGGHAIEEPHVMTLAVILDEREVWI